MIPVMECYELTVPGVMLTGIKEPAPCYSGFIPTSYRRDLNLNKEQPKDLATEIINLLSQVVKLIEILEYKQSKCYVSDEDLKKFGGK